MRMRPSNQTTTMTGEPSPGTPIFLRKTYDMINTCDDNVAAWDDGGKTFAVKDTERFSTEVIPNYFKHNNFSSFVRQLNFYGFRKIKSGSLRIADAASSDECKYWKFRHEKFQRGRPELLSEIRKSSCENADKQEVEQLKSEVNDLKGALASVTDELAELKAHLGCFAPVKGYMAQENDFSLPEVASKKLKGMGEYLVSVPSCDSLTLAALNVLPTSASYANASWINLKSAPSDVTLQSLAGNFPVAVSSTASFAPPRVTSNDVGGQNSEWPDMSRVPFAPAMSRTGSFGSLAVNEDVMVSLLGTDEPYFIPGYESAMCPTSTYHA